MRNKLFWILFALIILFGFILRIYATHNNNFYFTVDQGRDAVYIREIINYHKIFTKGPQSSVAGIYTGPLWYYFIAIGYGLMNGNPAGSALVLIILNLFITGVIVWQIKKHVNWKIALIIGFGMQIFWDFFKTSLYGFNPFPLVALSILTILLLVNKKYGFALIPIILAFNTELAGAMAFFIFYIFIGIIWAFEKKLDFRDFFIFGIGVPGLGILKIINDFLSEPISGTVKSGQQVFAGFNFIQIAEQFVKMGVLYMIAVAIMYLTQKNKNRFVKSFVYLSFGLIVTSYFFFSTNQGWRDWHTVFISPLVFISVLLMIWEFGRFKYLVIGAIFIFQIINFKNNFVNYLKPSPDPGLLYNQMKVLDWIYTNSEGNGFNAYTYTSTFYDYNYQYLFNWYGKAKYGFYPCEYSNFPLSIKDLYIPNPQHYVEPKLGCDKFRFLIIESDTNGEENKDWINEFRIETHFVSQTQIGNTLVEKRKTRDIY